ncbi:MAG: ribosome maturation factor RimM [Bryobacteraceae bacterium]
MNTGPLVAVAHLVRARGIKGELVAIPLSDRRERFDQLKRVLVNDAELEIERVWWHGEKLILKFRGIDSMTAAESLAGADVSIPAAERPALPEDEVYLSDLIGCEVIDRVTGRSIGTVSAWQDSAGPPLLVLADSPVLIPFARAICREIDVTGKRILIDAPEGLLDLNP